MAVSIDGWLTTGDAELLRPMQTAAFSAAPVPAGLKVIEVDSSEAFQPIEGFGFALTGGSASLIGGMVPAARTALLEELFGTGGNAIGLSCLRLSIGASDMGRASFSYCDTPPGQTDPELSGFDLGAGDPFLIPVLREILRINPDLKIIAAPWSAPPWMKTNGSFVAGNLKPVWYGAYAAYFVKYIQAMRGCGIHISAVSPQNEPGNPKNNPSLLMSASEQADFIANHLGPALRRDAPDTDILIWDHNCDHPDYPLAVLENAAAREFVGGVAWHLYAGSADAMSFVQARFPDKKVYFTEQWISAHDGFAGALRWHMQNVVIGALRNWSRTVLEWNLASDPECSLHTPGGAEGALGGITVGETVTRNAGYYLMAHTAKFIRPGAVRIHSTSSEALPNVACLTPAGDIVMLLLNTGADAIRCGISNAGETAVLELPGGAVGTLRWEAREGKASF